MGLAVIVPDIDFSGTFLGQVTIKGDIPVSGIYISGPSSVDANTAQFKALFIPQNTSERGIVWSITNGAEYAVISADGIVTPLTGASLSPVTIKATSTEDSSIFATKDIVVTASGLVFDLATLNWTQGERLADGSINAGDGVWGTITEPIDITGYTQATATVPSDKTNFIVEVMYFDSNDVNLGGPKYLFFNGRWSSYGISIDTNIPTGATKMYISSAIHGRRYAAGLADGVVISIS